MFKKISDIKQYIGSNYKAEDVNKYQKFAKVRAMQGKEGQEVVTIMANGLQETKNVVKSDEKGNPDWIITNPSGEQYIVPDKKFRQRYDVEKEKDGVYPSVYSPIDALQIKEDISFTAPWGETMNIKQGGYLVVTNPNDIYGIQEPEFKETYMPLNEYKKIQETEEEQQQ